MLIFRIGLTGVWCYVARTFGKYFVRRSQTQPDSNMMRVALHVASRLHRDCIMFGSIDCQQIQPWGQLSFRSHLVRILRHIGSQTCHISGPPESSLESRCSSKVWDRGPLTTCHVLRMWCHEKPMQFASICGPPVILSILQVRQTPRQVIGFEDFWDILTSDDGWNHQT